MRVFRSFVLKEFRHVWRDRRSLLILLGLPVVMILIFGFALSNEVKNARVAILDPSQDEVTQRLVDRLDQSQYFIVETYLDRPEDIEATFRRGDVKLAVVFPPDFSEQLEHAHAAQIQLVGDASDPNTASTIIQYASAIIGDYQQELLGDQQLPYRIEVSNRMLYNPQLESSYTFVPGVMTLILMLLGVMMTAVSIVKEKEMGTMEVLLVSPMQPLLVLISKAVPYVVLCFIDVLILLALSYTVLGMPLRGNLFLLLLECLLFIVTTLSLGLLVSNVVDNQQVAMFISGVGFMMPALVFSGFMFPIENMPLVLQVISYAVPTRWFYDIVSKIMVKGLGLGFIWQQTLILGGMTIFFVGLALRNFKIRLA
ncbi:MAG: ABC transporter permease [Lewinella sp.]|nr:ABC transporter permease [Lewinella sp.]